MLSRPTMLVWSLLLCTSTGACAQRRVVGAGTAVKITHLYQSERSRTGEPVRLVITSAAALDSLLNRVGREFVQSLTPIDFSTNEVIAVALGGQSAAGPIIMIDSVVDLSDVRRITVTRTDYRNGCTLPSAITRPVDIAMVPRSTRSRVTFVERTKLLPCPY